MLNAYTTLKKELIITPRKWLITGVAGFIGSNLLEELLKLNQTVIGMDNFVTGHQQNIDEVLGSVESAQAKHFRFIESDIRDLSACHEACREVDIVLHHAALGSVPWSINDPIASNQANVDGFVNMLVAARDAKVKKFVYAASSAVYGDHQGLPQFEDTIGNPLSPYAVTKYVNELYAKVFGSSYGMRCIGLRYFNVFGHRQDPDGAYAAVIPKWVSGLLRGEPVYINGDGETSRDFCYIKNVLQANLLAGLTEDLNAIGQVYNIAFGERTSLNELFGLIRDQVAKTYPELKDAMPIYRDFCPGDVRHSVADISKATSLLGYQPKYSVRDGLIEAASWYVEHLK